MAAKEASECNSTHQVTPGHVPAPFPLKTHVPRSPHPPYATRNHWSNLGDMSASDAMKQYIEMLTNVDPDWQTASSGSTGQQQKQGGAGGPVFSTMRDPAAEQQVRHCCTSAGTTGPNLRAGLFLSVAGYWYHPSICLLTIACSYRSQSAAAAGNILNWQAVCGDAAP